MAHLYAARAYDLAGKRDAALSEYREVLTRPDIYAAHEEAKKGLSSLTEPKPRVCRFWVSFGQCALAVETVCKLGLDPFRERTCAPLAGKSNCQFVFAEGAHKCAFQTDPDPEFSHNLGSGLVGGVMNEEQ